MIIGWRNRGSGHPATIVTVTIPKSAILAKEAAQPLKAKAYTQKDKSSVSKSTIHLWAGTGKGTRRQEGERFSQSSKREQGII